MEQSGTSTRLAGAVQGLMSELVSALRSGDRFRLAGAVARGNGPEATADPALAAVRVVGADVVLPSVLLRCAPPASDDLTVFSRALHAYPPPTGAPPTSVWSHWAMRRALLRLDASLEKLGARDRLVLRLYYLDGVPLKSIASLLGVSRNTIWPMVTRARQRLYRRMSGL
jgi:DNA-directed RNA polymerase specialized sigma24 family protein